MHERTLIDFLANGPFGRPELLSQADAARVVATCSCGCPSVWLEVDPEAPPANWNDDESPYGTGETMDLAATSGDTTVILHCLRGYLYELEIWAGFGVRPHVDREQLEHRDWR